MIGNIKQKTYYAYTTGTPTGGTAITYGYDTVWKDKLTSYNGKAITYDAIGNPLTYDGWTYTWQAGRQLAKMQKTGMTVEFKYNHSGLRTQKKVMENGVTTTTDYTLHGKLITHLTKGNETLHFFYDAQSKPAMVEYNGAMYRYVHNLQGDIVGIIDSAGSFVVEYRYDAWGEPTSATGTLADTLGKCNLFRYRGYVYDGETGLYYLRSRYYNPEVGRFVNADALLGNVGGLGSHNVYAYCANEPISHIDSDGFKWYESAWNRVKQAATDVGNWTARVADDVWNWTKNAAEDFGRWTKKTVVKVGEWVASTVTGAVSNIGNWWETKAKPWLNSVREANIRAAEINTEVKFNAYLRIGEWIANNWKDVVDTVGYAYSGVSLLTAVTERFIPALTIPGPALIVMLGIDGAFFLYETGDRLEWW